MSSLSNHTSSSSSGKRRSERERGMPRACRCGQGSMIRTSGTAKNPGRLFYCCPNGSEGDKHHLFKWTDECMVEEIEDLQAMVVELKRELSDMNVAVVGYDKQILELKEKIVKIEGEGKECINELHNFKKMMVCGLGIAVMCYYFMA